MTFLALILALALRQLWGVEPWLHRDRWWYDYRERVAALGLLDAVQLLLLVLLPTLLLGALLMLLAPVLFGLPWILLAALVLLFSFGRGDFHARLVQYRAHCERGNPETAWLFLCGALGADDLARAASEGEADDAWHRLQARLLYDGYQRWFAVVLVFVTLGPAWAFAYRLLQLEAQQAPECAAARLLFVVDWVPARLLALTFALAGDFIHSRDVLFAALLNTVRAPAELLGDVGTAAVHGAGADADVQTAADDMQALGDLLTRSAVIWVVVIALVAIIG